MRDREPKFSIETDDGRKQSAPESEAPFGSKKRDWTFLWRATIVALSLVSTSGVGLILYAGDSYMQSAATKIANALFEPLKDIPPRVKRLEEITETRGTLITDLSAYRVRQEIQMQRLTLLLENQQRQMERQQSQADRQQNIIDQLAARR